jgi:UPF0271 protein
VVAFLNIDAGELEDEPEELWASAHAVNIACGGHAGDAASMARALERCVRYGTRAGAHPSYPDRAGFGRAAMAMGAEALAASVATQCAALAEVAMRVGVTLEHVKPHGALYHAANGDPELARAVIDGALRGLAPVCAKPAVLGPERGALRAATGACGLPFVAEGFADRGRRADGSLVPRG